MLSNYRQLPIPLRVVFGVTTIVGILNLVFVLIMFNETTNQDRVIFIGNFVIGTIFAIGILRKSTVTRMVMLVICWIGIIGSIGLASSIPNLNLIDAFIEVFVIEIIIAEIWGLTARSSKKYFGLIDNEIAPNTEHVRTTEKPPPLP